MEIWDQATEFHKAEKYAEAEKLYDQLLTQNPQNPGLLATLGTLYLQTNKVGLAIALLEASLKNDSKRQGDVLSNLGVCYNRAGLQSKARACLDESVKLDPSAQALANYAGQYIESGQPEKVVAACEKAISTDPELPIAHWNLSLALLSEGNWARGWDEHEWGLKTKGMRADRTIGDLPEWDGTPGQSVVVYGEQGIGDEIMFASILPDLMKTNPVVFECHERLTNLFINSFPGVPCYGTREDSEVAWLGNHKLDARLSIGSLGKFYRRSRESFPGTPYLKTDPLPKKSRFRVGISWTGGQKPGRVQKRTVPLSWWKSILNVTGVEFVSLQYTECKEELDRMNALGYEIRDMDHYVKAHDYNETARVVASCDLVISVCTSVIHLAGALGVPCWVMTPKNPAWRYKNSGGMSWYRSVRLYRQPTPEADTWVPVVSRIAFDLDELANGQQLIARIA